MNLTPEFLASLRKAAEHMRAYGLMLQDARGEVTLALLDRLEELEKELASTHTALGHATDCGCASCRDEHPARFSTPADP